MNRNWLYVLVAGLVEIIWVIGLSHSNSVWEWLGTAIAIIISFYLIIESAKRLPVGTVYAVFTGIGTAGTVTTEMLLFGEPFKLTKVILIAILLTGVIGLKLVTDDSAGQDQEVAN
ncbi:paired small multidrug resistance pump [Paenibacillus uliginis N3/975]|uniref:Paired small multidrug resistance pump n=1 Tax=Paenibacillus uliginis N3/975 TaxID=1313296 RepID=A0A1X7GAB4_9BACL|nr:MULTISPECIES: multidrug efflux SMR transporter [Paenibacillus]UNK18132.1 multidrug efflux SMR transporter [Paenibacillus sp. N3/727]SMF66626.1 paired small multidrug resistance pump [Paenibacillus uliginis N3/975]